MAGSDFITLATNLTGLTEGYAASQGSTLNTGDLRRQYSLPFDRVAEINIASEPFFAIVHRYRKKPADDPEFKFVEKRQSFHKRYGYVVGHGPASISVTGQATIAAALLEAGDTYYWRIATDYKSAGNVGVIFDAQGNTRNAFLPGAAGTRPEFFIVGQHIKIPFVATAGSAGTNNTNSFKVVESVICRIESITLNTYDVDLKTIVVKGLSAERDLAGWGLTDGTGDTPISTSLTAGEFAKLRTYDELERMRVYVTGDSHSRGSGYPGARIDNPYSTGFGYTQIYKATAHMDNTTRATVLKYEGNEFSRMWDNTILDYKNNVENSFLFEHQGTTTDGSGNTIYLTQGAADYALNYGNIFTLGETSKSMDDFMVDFATYQDVRYNSGFPSLFLADKRTMIWFSQLSGFAFNNTVAAGAGARVNGSYAEWKNIKLGNDKLQTLVLKNPYGGGDASLVYDMHLDGTEICILGIDLGSCWYRPLSGNNLDRDTKIYRGVQTLETTGIDAQVDLIQGEMGMEFNDPARFAAWKRA